jgi:hypothetical protein
MISELHFQVNSEKARTNGNMTLDRIRQLSSPSRN